MIEVTKDSEEENDDEDEDVANEDNENDIDIDLHSNGECRGTASKRRRGMIHAVVGNHLSNDAK